jgi:lipid-binding SYLF domain-containing protein
MHHATVAFALGAAILAGAPAVKDEAGFVRAADLVENVKRDIPTEYWDHARCIVAIPAAASEPVKGVSSCRSANGWSAPLFVQLAMGKRAQASAGHADLVLLVMRDSAVQKILGPAISLDLDASVGPGPRDGSHPVRADEASTVEILWYALSSGRMADVDLSGSVLSPDESANVSAYGQGASPRTILASREMSAPIAAAPFLRVLRADAASKVASVDTTSLSSTRAAEPQRSEPKRSAPQAELRALAVEAQETIDRLLADASPATVGTSGAGAPTAGDRGGTATVTVDRARLLHVRQQLEVLVGRLDGR